MALGQENNTGLSNEPGLYKDPVSGAELEVSMSAGADALARMGWTKQEGHRTSLASPAEQEAPTTADEPVEAPITADEPVEAAEVVAETKPSKKG